MLLRFPVPHNLKCYNGNSLDTFLVWPLCSPMTKSPSSEPNISADLSRSRRDRLVILALICLLFCGLVVYLVITVSSAHSARVRTACERNESTARLCAQLLDEQCDSAFSVLQALARRSVLENSIAQGELKAAARSLQDAVELVPDLLATALYRADGTLLERYPQDAVLQSSVRGEAWFLRVSQGMNQRPPYVNDVVRLPDAQKTEAFTVAIPIGKENQPPVGYLLAFFRLGDIYNWLRVVHVESGAVLITDSVGRIVVTSSENGPGSWGTLSAYPNLPPGYLPFDRARRGKYGAFLYPAPETLTHRKRSREMIIGYAFAKRPGWSVLVMQPTEEAFAASELLLRRLAIIGGPLLLALPIVGWILVTLYERQQRLTVALAHRNELLRRADLAKSDLLANVSHDLKTPIASMQLSVSGILEGTPSVTPDRAKSVWDASQIADCLNLVSQELDHLAARVRNLLDMSRLEAETAPALRETCDLVDVVAGVLERLRPLMRDRRIEASFPPTPLLVECDQGQMETVVLNLLENALKYSPPRSPLRLTGAVEAKNVVLSVADRGPGLPAGEEQRVFEKFFRVGTPHAAGGTGLGLAICRMILEAHGGMIGARSLEEGGAEFTIVLPLSDLAEPDAESVETETRP